MSENPVLKTPGEMISEARKAQDLTIAQLSDRTKIPPPVLSALELDEYHKISGPLYIKSFLRTCAVDLGLDPTTVLGVYHKISGEKKPGPNGQEMVWKEDRVEVSHVGLPWIRIILVIGVVVTLVGLALFALRGCGSDQETTAAVGTLPTAGPASPDPVPPTSAKDGIDAGDHESLMAAETEEELRRRADARQRLETLGAENGSPAVLPHDTLAVAGPVSRPAAATEQDPVPKTEPALPTASLVRADTQAVAPGTMTAAVPVDTPAAKEPIVVPPADAAPDFSGTGESDWPLVLRIVCDRPQDILVKRDGEATFRLARWPAAGDEGPALPAAGFEPGRAYAHDGQWTVFWGAEDHFSLKLGRVRGVAVFVNGRRRDVSRLRPGQEIILDDHAAAAGPR